MVYARLNNHSKWVSLENGGILEINSYRDTYQTIDLDTPQVIDPPLKCWVKDLWQTEWRKEELHAIIAGIEAKYITQTGRFPMCTLINLEPKERLMTKNEVLTFIQNTDMKIRVCSLNMDWGLPEGFAYNEISDYEWMEVDTRGIKIGQVQKFMIKE